MSKPERREVPGQDWGMPADGPIGIRHKGGVTLIQALVRNLGTCRLDAKGEIQADRLRKDQSADARHRGGSARSRDEGSVMELDRRGCVVQLWTGTNRQREEFHG